MLNCCPASSFCVLTAEEQLLRALELRVVERFLLAFDFAEQVFLDAVGQVLGDLGLGAAQEEGAHAGGQALAAQGIGLAVVSARERGAMTEHPGHGEAHEAPQIEQAVLDGRAGEDQPMFGVQGAGEAGGLRIGGS